MTEVLDPLLEEWITHYRGPLIGLIASWGADWGTAEELAMDTFAETWLSRDRLRGIRRDHRVIGPWLRGIAANLHRSRYRRTKNRREQPIDDSLAIAADAAPEQCDERLHALREAFAQLRPQQQTVLRMFYLDEASTRQVAALLTLSEKAVENRLYHARRALRQHAERIHAAASGASQ